MPVARFDRASRNRTAQPKPERPMTPTNQHRVLYLGHGSPDLYAMIRAAVLPGFELITLETNDEALRLEKLAEADAVIVAASKFTRERIKAAKKLKFVHHQGVGYH